MRGIQFYEENLQKICRKFACQFFRILKNSGYIINIYNHVYISTLLQKLSRDRDAIEHYHVKGMLFFY